MNTQYRKNLKAVAQACKDYTDNKIKKVYYDIGHNDITTDDHINEATYRFTAPLNSKLLMLQSIAGNSNKIAPSTPSDDSVARLKTIPDNTYKSQIDYIGGKTVKYNQLVELANNTQSFTANIDTTKTIQTNISCNANDKLLVVWYQNTTLTSNTRNTMQYTTISDGVSNYQSTSTNNNLTSGLKSWFIQPSGSFNLKYWGSMLSNDLTISQIEVINLTQKFGAGNEPSTVEEAIPLLKASGYKLDGTDIYSTGSLKHAIVSGVKYNPINLYSGEQDIDITLNNSYYYAFKLLDNFVNGKTYTISLDYLKVSGDNNVFYGTLGYGDTGYSAEVGQGAIVLTSGSRSSLTFTANNTSYKNLWIRIPRYTAPSSGTFKVNNIMLNEGSTALPYIPYVAPITKAIPNEVLADNRYGLGYDNSNYNHLDSDGHLRGSYVKYTFTGNETFITISTNTEGWTQFAYTPTPTAYESSDSIVLISGIKNVTYSEYQSVSSSLTEPLVYHYGRGYRFVLNATTIEQARTILQGKTFEYELATAFDEDYSQYFDTNWNKVDLDKQYATCEMVVDNPIDMPNKVEYYGTIIHSLATAVKYESFNVWDEEWEVGRYNTSTGAKQNASDRIRCKNPISVYSNTTYYFFINTTSANLSKIIYYYDDTNNYISSYEIGQTSGSFTTPSNCKYITFNMGSGYGTTYKNDICINISNQALNGTYKPYKAPITRLLPNSEEKYSWGITDGVRNTRVFCDDEGNAVNEGSLVVGNQDLGGYNYFYQTNGVFNSITTIDGVGVSGSNRANVICPIYDNANANSVVDGVIDKSITIYTNSQIYICDKLFNNGSILKSSLNGVPLFYEKNATDTETLDDFDYFFDCEEGDTFTIIGCELLQCYATYSFLIKEAKSNE